MREEDSLSLKRQVVISLRMLRIAWQIRAGAVGVFFVGVLLEICGFVASLYATSRLGALLAAFITSGETAGIWLWLWLDIASGSVMAFGFFLMSYTKQLLYFAFVRWSTNTFLQRLCWLDLPDFYDEDIRNQINKLGSGYIWQLPNLSDANLDLIYGILRFVSITVIVSQITWWLVPVLALFLIPTLLAERRLALLQWFVWDAKGDQRHVFWGLLWILRQPKSQMELRSSQATQYVLNKVDQMNKDFYSEQEKRYRHASRYVMSTKVLEAGGTALGLIIVLRQFLARTISLDRYFFLSGGLLRIGSALNNIFSTLSRMQEPLLFADSFFDLVERKPQIIDPPRAIELSDDKVPEIVFENVSFTYPGQSTAVFHDLNLYIQGGEHIAIVGENGAGKSTLVKLLLRLYRPSGGRILINGCDLNDIAIESWYSLLGTLFQEFNQYPMPIGENITIGRPSQQVDSAQLEKAAALGGIAKMLASYEHGWETVLDSSFEKGIEPSGGQWQRVALARVFYRHAPVLILDEPTAAIDANAEYEIFNNIFTHYRGKTTIIISHRFSTVRRADRIIVLEHGKIVESGSHTELLRQVGLYHEMFNKQAEGYR